ncbi:response regulator [Nisaea denitrificans]|uniref:response regulator n=1 Tax=Nisaea denitrificans TaxID=390877 RepID=UPI00048EFAAA|nr:response regulator [Nisaea denitrificans]
MPPKNPHILVVDDHRNIREPLAKYLGENGFRVSMAANGAEMDTVVKAASIDLIVLDILMPGEGGLEICRRIRETRDIPVILLTAVANETDRIVGLEIGADDYLTKPFNPRELLARIKGVLRRVHSLPKQYSGIEAGQIGFGAWVLDLGRQALRKESDGQETALSTVEFRLLMTFLDHPKMVLSRDQLLDMVSSRAANVFDRSIDNQVSRLRKKIEVDPKNPEIVKTVWGGGYMFALDVARR